MNQRETLKIPSDSPPVVYEGVAGVRTRIGGQSGHTAVYKQTERRRMVMMMMMMMAAYRGLDVDRVAQRENR